jgi:hypothetical protein
MMAFRFSDTRQKEAQLAILRDLLVEHQEDQLAKTVLSNSIGLASATMVAGELDEMIATSNRWYRRNTRIISMFFVALAIFELAFGWLEWRHRGSLWGMLGPSFFAVGLLTYCWALQGMWRIQMRYHDTLKMLEDMQLVLPATPFLKAMH